jgi:hypothetical protein
MLFNWVGDELGGNELLFGDDLGGEWGDELGSLLFGIPLMSTERKKLFAAGRRNKINCLVASG